MRVVVTGGTGLVGSRTSALLASRGHEVLALSRRLTGPEPEHVQRRACDLRDRARTLELITGFQPELVLHAAGVMDPDACERDPELAWAANVESTAHVALAARRIGAHLVHTSTDYVFDGAAGPYREDDLPNPRGVYPLTKRASEEAVLALHPTATIARTAVVYGWPASYRTNFGSWLLENLSAGKPVRLFQDQLVSPTWAGNAAEMIAELGERKLPGVWHTAGGAVVDRVTFGRALCAEFGFDEELLMPSSLKDAPLTATRPARAGLVTEKARGHLSARPLPLEESLRRFHQEWRS